MIVHRKKAKLLQNIYSILFFSSLLLFLINYIIQGYLLFTYADYYGIILKMNSLYWVGYALMLALVCFQYSKFDYIDDRYIYLTVFLAVMYLIATPFLYENLPRFEDTWGHSFLTQEVFENKKVQHGISIYEQYPGSIFFYGLLFNFIPSYYVMKFFPPLFYFIGIIIIYALFKGLFNKKTAFLILVLYMLFNWTVEDNHISPQFLILNTYFLFVLVSAKLLYNKNDWVKYFITLTLLGTAIVFSHPLTPIFLLFILAAIFVLCKEFRTKTIPIATMLLVIFIVYSAANTAIFEYMAEHFQVFIDIFTHGLARGGPTQRFGTTLLSRQIFLVSRVGLTLVSVIFGLVGVVVMRIRKDKTTANFLLAWAVALLPFVIFVGLAIEGEFYERFALISSLPLAALAAYLFNESKIKFAGVLLFLLLLSPLYFVGKYGNEAFESVSVEKLVANCYSYELDSSCIEHFRIVDTPLNYNIEGLGRSYFVISREDEMASSVFNSKSLDIVTDSIDTLVEEHKLNKVYSTNTASVFATP